MLGLSGRTSIIRMDKNWGFDVNDIVSIELYDIDTPDDKKIMIKKLSNTGNSVGFYCDSDLGLTRGHLIVFSVRKIGERRL